MRDDTSDEDSSATDAFDDLQSRIDGLEMQIADLANAQDEPFELGDLDADDENNEPLPPFIPDTLYADADPANECKSVQVESTKGMLEVYGFRGANVGTVPIKSAHSTGYKHVDWIERGSPAPSDCGLADASAGTTGIAFADHVHHITGADYATTSGEARTVVDISDHDHGELEGLSDDDHNLYWRRGSDYTRNYGTGIGLVLGVDKAFEVISLSDQGVKLFSITDAPGLTQVDGVKVTNNYRGLFNAVGLEVVNFSNYFDVTVGQLYVGGEGPFDVMTIDVPDGSGAMKTIKILGMET